MDGPRAAEPDPPRRRLSRERRHRQLIAAAIPLAARQGLAALSLEDLGARAGVTRNLIYHYFPRGRADVVLAVVQEAEGQLARGGASLAALLDHALAPTHAWRIHRMARAASDAEVRASVARGAQELVRELSRVHLGTTDPPPVADVSLRGYLSFAEAALDRGRAVGVPRADLERLLDQMLRAALEAARR